LRYGIHEIALGQPGGAFRFEEFVRPVSSGLGFSQLFEKENTSKKYLLGNARWAAFGPRGHGGRKLLKKHLGIALIGVSRACLFLVVGSLRKYTVRTHLNHK
jgi:hypothetical protein